MDGLKAVGGRDRVKLTVTEFARFPEPAAVVICSLDRALYQVMVVVDGRERLLVEDGGRPLRRRSLQQVREALGLLPVRSLLLRQLSAYDEMVGQPPDLADNRLEIPLALADDPPVRLH